MSEFLLIFIITLIALVAVTAALTLGRPPVYLPDSDQVLDMLTRLLDFELTDQEWQLFIAVPISHDADMETIRQKCIRIAEQYSLTPKNNKVRLTESGVIAVRHITHQLKRLGHRTF